jgi:putative phage-type endonuclease
MSTDAAIIMGVNPWKNEKTLWEEKIGIKDPDPENDAMRRGKELEPIALQKIMELFDCAYAPLVYQSDSYPWMATSLDGISEFSDEILEIKCPSLKKHTEYLEKVIPEYYMCQLQHHMMTTGLPSIVFVSYCPEHGETPLFYFDVERNDDFIKVLCAKEKDFYRKLREFEEPKEWVF